MYDKIYKQVFEKRGEEVNMVFRNSELNGTGEIVVYSNYHPYWNNRETRERNPRFDVFSGKLLDLKEGKPSAIEYFFDILDKEINPGVTICVVPSSDADNTDSGIAKLALALANSNRKDMVYYLQRKKSIPKLAHGGYRGKEVHYQSIETVKDMDITGDIVLLMDDITTSGNSLYACKNILIESGADTVEMFALGKTVRD